MANESGMCTNHAEFQREKVDNLLYLKHNATKRIKLFHIKPWMPTMFSTFWLWNQLWIGVKSW